MVFLTLIVELTLHNFFFFQAEDGIRDVAVTGVQTCALPISDDLPQARAERAVRGHRPRALRGRGQAVHLGGGVRARPSRGAARRAPRLHPAGRPRARRYLLLDQLLSRAGRPPARGPLAPRDRPVAVAP